MSQFPNQLGSILAISNKYAWCETNDDIIIPNNLYCTRSLQGVRVMPPWHLVKFRSAQGQACIRLGASGQNTRRVFVPFGPESRVCIKSCNPLSILNGWTDRNRVWNAPLDIRKGLVFRALQRSQRFIPSDFSVEINNTRSREWGICLLRWGWHNFKVWIFTLFTPSHIVQWSTSSGEKWRER